MGEGDEANLRHGALMSFLRPDWLTTSSNKITIKLNKNIINNYEIKN
jgi:hypothetical protein